MTIETVGVVAAAGSTRPAVRKVCATNPARKRFIRAGHSGDEGVKNPVSVTKVT